MDTVSTLNNTDKSIARYIQTGGYTTYLDILMNHVNAAILCDDDITCLNMHFITESDISEPTFKYVFWCMLAIRFGRFDERHLYVPKGKPSKELLNYLDSMMDFIQNNQESDYNLGKVNE